MSLRSRIAKVFNPPGQTRLPRSGIGTSGIVSHGGFVQEDELNKKLASRETRYKTYSEMMANTAIVGAGVRYFLNLAAKSAWSFNPSEADKDGYYAEQLEQILTHDPLTSWHRVVRRATMYRFYGFSIQEWVAKPRPDDSGVITFYDIENRPQSTIYRWHLQRSGTVLATVQQDPQDFKEYVLPRGKLLYLVDDTIRDHPEGLGLFRHMVSSVERLTRYIQLEGIGFDTDLRGIPIGRAPFTELAALETAEEITREQRLAIEKPIRNFVERHVRNEKTSMLLDSIPYESRDEAGRPSTMRQWDIELLKGSSNSFKENASAINRINREIARILGVEHLMIGGDGAGSMALSEDKTRNFYLLVNGALIEMRDAVKRDLAFTIWRLNGWPDEMMPDITTEAVRLGDVEQIGKALRDIAAAGGGITPRDPVVDAVRDRLDLPRTTEETLAPDPVADGQNAQNAPPGGAPRQASQSLGV